MSIYAAIESVIVLVVALISAYYVLKLIVPGPMRRMRARIAERLSKKAGSGSPLGFLAVRLQEDNEPSAGCATGCESGGCNGCNLATRTDFLSARDSADRA